MLNRPDPFFAQTRPTRNVLESLHRTYGEPRGALPKRDEAAFQRAVEFRTKEKAKYAALETENQRLQEKVTMLETSRHSLLEETEKIKALWSKLSKRPDEKHDVVQPGQRSVRTGDGPVAEHANTRNSRSGDDRSNRVVSAVDADDAVEQVTPNEARVRRKVLPASGPPDARGCADEHSAEGPEPRSGPRATSAAVSEPTVREDEE